MQRGLNYSVRCHSCCNIFKVKKYRQLIAKYCSQECCGKSKLGQIAWNNGKSAVWILGDKNPNWKGGIAKENKLIRASIQYRLWREAVFSRDGYTCQKCAVIGGILHPHHIKSFSKFINLRFAIDNGITLCVKCHRDLHKVIGHQ